MAEKEFTIPPEILSQVDTLKSMLLNITEQKTDSEDLVAMTKNEAEINIEGKKPKQALIKSQLALYKKELKKTKQDIEQVKKALSLITDMQQTCFATISAARKDITNERYKDLLSDILKEAAETLPLWISEKVDDCPPPLCGAVQPETNYIAKCADLVAAFVSVKNNAREWILAEVTSYNPVTARYSVQDIDDAQNAEYGVSRDKVIPLPALRADPEQNPSALFCKGTFVLALYENTTCFYKGVVHEAPARATEPYEISFEDNDCTSGYSQPTSVPQRYVLAYRTFED